MPRKVRSLFVLGLLLLSLPCFAQNARILALIQEGDQEETTLGSRAALTSFLAAETLEPNNPAILVRIAKQYSDLVDQTKPPREAEKLGELGLAYAKRAVSLDPASAKAHLCLAVCYGKLTDFADNRTKVEYARHTKEEADKSLCLDPTDDFAYHVLGRWNYGVANLNPVVKWIARLSYGGLPPASNEEAAKDFRKAADMAPQRIIHHNELARVYVALGKTDLARKEWQTILDLPVQTKEDEAAKEAAKESLRRN
jgi:tetratricopeptide (TPR) repeat protein